jgi:hypothetical protein
MVAEAAEMQSAASAMPARQLRIWFTAKLFTVISHRWTFGAQRVLPQAQAGGRKEIGDTIKPPPLEPTQA